MPNPPGPVSRTPTPSTPPFLNLASPDFKSYKTFLRSPARNGETDERLALSEMDFEAAYAILTKSPSFNNQLTPTMGSPQPLLNPIPSQLHPIPILPQEDPNFTIDNQLDFNPQSPRSLRYALNRSNKNSPQQQLIHSPNTEMMNEMKEFFFKGATPSPHHSPNMIHSKLLSPMENLVDLESLQYFSKYDELLSVNESNALEQFLDSIIDDKKAKNTHHHHQDKTFNNDSIDFDNAYNNAIQAMENDDNQHNTLGLGSPLIPNVYENKRTYNETNKQPEQIVKKERKKRKVLSEEQKKLNHTTSEQRRRTAIKDAFDNLVALLPTLNQDTSLSKRKNLPKSVVLEKTVSQIETLINANNELKRILNEI